MSGFAFKMNAGTSSKRPAAKKAQISDLFGGDSDDDGDGPSARKGDAKKSRTEAPPPQGV